MEKQVTEINIKKARQDFTSGLINGIAFSNEPGMCYIIEYMSESDRTVRLLRYTPGKTPLVEHWCHACKSGAGCKHLAYGPLVEEAVNGHLPVAVTVENREPVGPAYIKDITPEILGRPGKFTKAVLAGPKTGKKLKTQRKTGRPKNPVRTDISGIDFTDMSRLEVCEYLSEQNLPDSLIEKVVKNRRKENPEKPSRLYHGIPALRFCLAALLSGKNLFLVGHKSTGKDTLVDTLGWCMGFVPYKISGFAEMTAEHLLFSREAEGRDGDFRTFNALGILPQAMSEGKMLVINEATAIKPEVLVGVHPATDKNRCIYVPGYGDIRAKEGFGVIYAANTVYEGLFATNEATVDRTVVWEMEYNREALALALDEQTMLGDRKTKEELLKLFDDLMEAVRKNRLDSTRGISFRGILDAADLIEMGVPPSEALRSCISNKILEPKEISEDRTTIDDIISSRFGGGGA